MSRNLTFTELWQAKVLLIHSVQQYSWELEALNEGCSVPKISSIFRLSLFVGEDGFLRVPGCLQFSELTEAEKTPIVSPKGHFGTLPACHADATLKHAGLNSMPVRLRDQYWIVGARCICKRVKRQCVACQRQDVCASAQSMAPLPDFLPFVLWDGWMNQAYSRLSTTHSHITDCKLLVCVYWTRLVLVRIDHGGHCTVVTFQAPSFISSCSPLRWYMQSIWSWLPPCLLRQFYWLTHFSLLVEGCLQ